MPKVTVTVEGGQKIEKILDGYLSGVPKSVKAGVLGDSEGAGKVLEYAPIQEFGGTIKVTPKLRFFLGLTYGVWLSPKTKTLTIPARSFMRLTFAENHERWINFLSEALRQQLPVEQALSLVGTMMEDDIVAMIMSNLPPPNSSMTRKIKMIEAPENVDRTLYMTGALAHSIKYQLVDE